MQFGVVALHYQPLFCLLLSIPLQERGEELIIYKHNNSIKFGVQEFRLFLIIYLSYMNIPCTMHCKNPARLDYYPIMNNISFVVTSIILKPKAAIPAYLFKNLATNGVMMCLYNM